MRLDLADPRARRFLAMALLLLSLVLLAWFGCPALVSAYTEGFESTISANARYLAAGRPGDADLLYPFIGRFFFDTRLGMALLLAGVRGLGGFGDLWSFRLLLIASLGLLLASVVLLMRRTYRAPFGLTLLACILFPAICESAWLPNDDLPSAALSSLALLLFWSSPTILRTIAMAILMGLAVTIRLDAALIAPAFAILLLTELPDWRARIVRALIAGVIVILLPLLIYRACGQHFLDSFAIVDRGLRLWDRHNSVLRNDTRVVLFNVSLPGLVAAAAGIASFWTARRWRELGLTLLVPLLYAVAYRAQLFQGRYLLPLAPFVVIAIVEGLRRIAALDRRRPLLQAVFALAVLSAIFPPSIIPFSRRYTADADGPRLLVGRLWNPLVAISWSNGLNHAHDVLDAAIDRELATPAPVIVAGYWSSDRLVTLLLLERGFHPEPVSEPPACRDIAVTYRRGPVALLLIRTHIPFIPRAPEANTWNALGRACLAAARPGQVRTLFVTDAALDTVGNRLTPTDRQDLLYASSAPGIWHSVDSMRSWLSGFIIGDFTPDEIERALPLAITPDDKQVVDDAIAHRKDLLR